MPHAHDYPWRYLGLIGDTGDLVWRHLPCGREVQTRPGDVIGPRRCPRCDGPDTDATPANAAPITAGVCRVA